MAVIHKCDVCKKPFTRQSVDVQQFGPYLHFEFCIKCAAPILAVLKKYKLLPAV
jgi:hypothetical protein